MAQIDALFRFLIEQHAFQLSIPADDSCQITDATGCHPINRVMTAEEVRSIVAEVLPEHLAQAWLAGEPLSFVRRSGESEMAIAVDRPSGTLCVRLSPTPAHYIEQLALAARAAGASDVVIADRAAPLLRVEGILQRLAGLQPPPEGVPAAFVESSAPDPLPPGAVQQFVVSLHRAGRARCSCLAGYHGVSLSLRLLPESVAPLDGIPPAFCDLLGERRGVLLAAAPPAHGLTTLLGAFLATLAERTLHVICLETLPEMPVPDGKALVAHAPLPSGAQRAEAIAAAASIGADVLLVDEIADAPSLRAVLDAARGGCLVVAGCRGGSVAEAVERLVQGVPGADRSEAREQLAAALSGAIAQVLCPGVDGRRIAVRDVLVATAASAQAVRQGRWDELAEGIRAVGFSRDDALLRLVAEERMLPADAEACALDRKRFREALAVRPRRSGHDAGPRHDTAKR